jgi:hypothetical protein
VLAESGEDLVDVVQMGREVGAEDDDVVEVDEEEDADEGAKDVVHEALEGGGCAGKSEEHDGELEGAEWGGDGCLVDVLLTVADLCEGGVEIEEGEKLGVAEGEENVLNVRHAGGGLDGLRVELTPVSYHSHGAVLLFNKEDGGTKGRRRGSDVAALEQDGELAAEFLKLDGVHAVGVTGRRTAAGDEVDGVLDGAARRQAGGEVVREAVGEGAEEVAAIGRLLFGQREFGQGRVGVGGGVGCKGRGDDSEEAVLVAAGKCAACGAVGEDGDGRGWVKEEDVVDVGESRGRGGRSCCWWLG